MSKNKFIELLGETTKKNIPLYFRFINDLSLDRENMSHEKYVTNERHKTDSYLATGFHKPISKLFTLPKR